MKEMLEKLREESLAAIRNADGLEALEALRVKYLGKKGEMTAVLKQMGKLSAEERPVMGQLANKVREEMTAALDEAKAHLAEKAMELKLKAERLDVTVPGTPVLQGHQHPLNMVLDEAKEIFIGMGFSIAEGPEVEWSEYNFTKLNTQEGHPARDRQDTFYFDDNDEICLRTQTSPVQVHVMETQPLPIRIISPGRVYRADEVDATHSPVFHQIEGLVIDENISIADLKGTLDTFAKRLYGDGVTTRFRPSFFPFTEPSAEVDLTCAACRGKGCHICKGTGWIEVLGSGMVNPKVLEMCGIDSKKYSGFAFGMGVERLANLKYNVPDMRYLYENDVRFLKQFRG